MTQTTNPVPERMRTVVLDGFGGPDLLRLVGRPVPAPGAGEVLVEVWAGGVNAIDLATRAGRGVPVPRFPAVLGWDVSGVVVGLGAGVTGLAAGDEVFGLLRFPDLAGGYAQYVVAPAAQLARKPAGVSHRAAAGAPMPALTAWQSLVTHAKVARGQRVLISGAAGGVGHIAVQLAHAAGAEVIGTATGVNHEFVSSLGADQMIDYTRQRITQVAKDVDVVLDPRGGMDFVQLLDVIKPGGIIVTLKDKEPGQEDLARSRGLRVAYTRVAPDGAVLGEFAKLLADGQVRVAVEQAFLLEEAGAAHLAGERGHVQGRIVLEMR
ncbi:MAG TPA: NADP-dependent oxidoreductase [Actinocrinis sp.]|nr:NADP-dependent oxidoreductase [Actinocrinis sp.]